MFLQHHNNACCFSYTWIRLPRSTPLYARALSATLVTVMTVLAVSVAPGYSMFAEEYTPLYRGFEFYFLATIMSVLAVSVAPGYVCQGVHPFVQGL